MEEGKTSGDTAASWIDWYVFQVWMDLDKIKLTKLF